MAMYMWPAPYATAAAMRPPWTQQRPQWPAAPWGKGAGAFFTKDPYLESSLRPEDREAYSAAGMIFYRAGDNGIEVLLAIEKPWNTLANDYDPLAWNPLGGKRAFGPSREWEAPATAARCIMEVLGGAEGAPSHRALEHMCLAGPVLWYPGGRFALYFHKVEEKDGEVFVDAPARFVAAKDKGLYPFGPEEPRVNAKGQPTTRWVKQIEELEWVNVSDLQVAETRKPLTDLLASLCNRVPPFQQFMQGAELPPSVPVPPPKVGAEESDGKDRQSSGKQASSKGGKKGGSVDKGSNAKGGGKKGGGYSGKAKGGKGKGDMGKGPVMFPAVTSMAPAAPMSMPQQMYPIEMQRQMLGEKLYLLVQPLVPTAIVAQKVTGMLLELPMPELMPLLGPSEGERTLLQTRIDEALEVLQAEDLMDSA